MANGPQRAQQNLEAFEVWQATQTDDDFKQIVFKGKLNRIEVAKGVGCGKSALNQNPTLRKALKALEDKLRDIGILPPLTESAKNMWSGFWKTRPTSWASIAILHSRVFFPLTITCRSVIWCSRVGVVGR